MLVPPAVGRGGATAGYEPTHHTIVAVDVAGSGSLDDREQLRMRARLRAVVSNALPLRSPEATAVDVADLGDGLRLVCPAWISPCTLLDPFVANVARALRLCREVVADRVRLRLRMVVHAGLLHRDDGGWAGEPLVHAARLLEAPPVRRALRAAESADLVVVVSRVIYDSVIRHGYGLDPVTCRKVRVRVKETVADAWLHVPGSGNPPGVIRESTRGLGSTARPDPSPLVPAGADGLPAMRGGRWQPATDVDGVRGRAAGGRAWGTTGQRGGSSVGGPRLPRMLLGAQLRRMREAVGITRDEAGEAIRSLESKIGRMEAGRVGFKHRDVADLLTLYDVVDDVERAAVLAQVEQTNVPGWWHGYADLLPNWLQSYLDLEAAAILIRSYEAQTVPGLLQTEEYARALIELGYGHADPDEINRRVALRMARQELLTRPDPPQLWVVMDEAVLRRPVGGRRVMREQLHALVHACSRLTIRLQILPFGAGAHAAAGGAFTILRFAERDLPDMVHLEHLTSALCLNRCDDVDQYSHAATRLFIQAETPTRTPDILRAAIQDVDRT